LREVKMVFVASGRGPRGTKIVVRRTLTEAEIVAASMRDDGFRNVRVGQESRL
jgi:hypothetical protein